MLSSSLSQLELCPRIGKKKANKLFQIFNCPLGIKKDEAAKKRKETEVPSVSSIQGAFVKSGEPIRIEELSALAMPGSNLDMTQNASSSTRRNHNESSGGKTKRNPDLEFQTSKKSKLK